MFDECNGLEPIYHKLNEYVTQIKTPIKITQIKTPIKIYNFDI